MSNTAKLETLETINAFIFGGKATFTLVSKNTQKHFTFRVDVSEDGHRHYVKVLTGPDNGRDYTFLGTFFGPVYSHGRRSPIGQDAPAARAFAWFANQLTTGDKLDQVEVWHEGRCGRCAHKLTNPESIASGIGPECAGKMRRLHCTEIGPDPIAQLMSA